MSTDISHLSAAELKELARNAEALALKKREDEKKDLIEDLRFTAEGRGYTLAELFGTDAKAKPATKPKGSKAAPKYRDPASGATWTGKGRQPEWFRFRISAGETAESLLIAGGA